MIANNERDCTATEVQEHEYKAWHDDPKKAPKWDAFAAARPYSVKGYEVKAPVAGAAAPDGAVLSMQEGGEASTLLAEVKKIAASSSSKYVALSFDSVTCPVWRMFGGQDLGKASKGIPCLHVYTREAHGKDDFDAPPNGSGPMALTREINMHKTEAERRQAACEAQGVMVKQLGAEEGNHWVLDNMEDSLEKAYEARPF